jgi:hypothetical protein
MLPGKTSLPFYLEILLLQLPALFMLRYKQFEAASVCCSTCHSPSLLLLLLLNSTPPWPLPLITRTVQPWITPLIIADSINQHKTTSGLLPWLANHLAPVQPQLHATSKLAQIHPCPLQASTATPTAAGAVPNSQAVH